MNRRGRMQLVDEQPGRLVARHPHQVAHGGEGVQMKHRGFDGQNRQVGSPQGFQGGAVVVPRRVDHDELRTVVTGRFQGLLDPTLLRHGDHDITGRSPVAPLGGAGLLVDVDDYRCLAGFRRNRREIDAHRRFAAAAFLGNDSDHRHP